MTDDLFTLGRRAAMRYLNACTAYAEARENLSAALPGPFTVTAQKAVEAAKRHVDETRATWIAADNAIAAARARLAALAALAGESAP